MILKPLAGPLECLEKVLAMKSLNNSFLSKANQLHIIFAEYSVQCNRGTITEGETDISNFCGCFIFAL